MIAILYNIRSLHNVGSIFRTADAAGIKKLYLVGITPAPNDRFGNTRSPLTKVSLGAENFVAWEKVQRGIPFLRALRREGCQIYAIEQARNSVPYHKIRLGAKAHKRAVLVVGNEVAGLPAAVLKLTHKILEIPMAGKKESLNVAVAFGIVAFALAEKFAKKA